MTDGQIAVYKADSTAAQEDGTVDFVFHVAMTSKMYYHVGGASYVTYNGTTVDGADSRIVVSTAMLNRPAIPRQRWIATLLPTAARIWQTVSEC